jgi:chromate transporter
VNVVSLALMAGVTWQLGRSAIFDPVSVLIAVVTLVLLFATKINPAWLVVGGGVVGLAARYLLG